MAKFLKKDNVLTFVDDPTEIEYLKFNNLRFSTIGCMLGDFDDKGIYCMDPRIVKELISMKKFLTSTVDNIEVCHSQLKLNKQIAFFVVYEGNRVSLVLAEKINYQANFKINSGIFSNINEYVLDSFETSGKIDKNIIYRKWNIDPYPGEVLDVFHMDEESLAIYFNLVKRFKYLMRANEILLAHEERLEEIESEYAAQMLTTIAKYPQLKEIVSKELKEVFTNKKDFLRADKPNFSKTLNEVISQCIDHNLDVLDEKDREYFLAEKRQAQTAYNQAVAKEIETAKLITKDNLTGEILSERPIILTRSLEQKKNINEVAASYAQQRTTTLNKAEVDEKSHAKVEKILKDVYGAEVEKPMIKQKAEANSAEKKEEVAAKVEAPKAVKPAAKAPVKKPEAKKAAAKKPEAKKPAPKAAEKPETKVTKPVAKKPETAAKAKRPAPIIYGPISTDEPKIDKDEIVIEERLLVKQEDEINDTVAPNKEEVEYRNTGDTHSEDIEYNS